MNKSMKIGNVKIGPNYEPVIIAEIGINHNGSVEKAIKIADAAIKSGAKIVKHQTHIVSDEMSLEAKKIKPGNANKNIYDLISKCSLSEENEYKLMRYVQKKNAIFISTPFSRKAVDRLVKFKIPAFKIGSGECNNYLLVDYIAKQKKPVILSTGMNSIQTIKPSVKIFDKYRISYALLQCTNLYPTPPKLIRLNDLNLIRKNFPKSIIGLSDHSTNIYNSIGAIALGACIIEKHFVDKKNFKGPDVSSSMDKYELQELIKASKQVFLARCSNGKQPVKEEKQTIKFAFASAVATQNLKKGQKLNLNNFYLKRPGNGDFNIKNYKTLINKKLKRNIKKNTQIKFKDI